MPRRSEGLNLEVGAIVGRVLGELSLEQAALQLNYRVSRTPIGDLKRGKVGRETTLRQFAEGFSARFCEEFGEDVRERFGECSERAVSDWLAEKAGFGRKYFQAPAPDELVYDPVLDDVDVRGFKGAQGLSESDINLVNTTLRTLLQGLRKQRGLDS